VATIDSGLRMTGKPPELQGLLNRTLYHPAARWLATRLAATPVTPNAVSVTGAVMVAIAGVCYAVIGGTAGVAIGFALHLAWHVVDGADGDLARMTGRASPYGEMIDGLCDYGGHFVLYILLAMRLDDTIGGWAWGLAVTAGLSRAVQSVFAESQRRTYQYWAYDVPWLQNEKAPQPGIGGALTRLYLAVSKALTGPTQAVNALVARAARDPAERLRIAVLARAAGRETLPTLAVLGANPRTIFLGISMIAGGPLWFFLIEATVLNGVLVVAIVRQAVSSRRLAQRIASIPS